MPQHSTALAMHIQQQWLQHTSPEDVLRRQHWMVSNMQICESCNTDMCCTVIILAQSLPLLRQPPGATHKNIRQQYRLSLKTQWQLHAQVCQLSRKPDWQVKPESTIDAHHANQLPTSCSNHCKPCVCPTAAESRHNTPACLHAFTCCHSSDSICE